MVTRQVTGGTECLAQAEALSGRSERALELAGSVLAHPASSQEAKERAARLAEEPGAG